MKKIDLVKYITFGTKELTELQKGELNSVHQKSIIRKAAQEVLGLTYNKALNFANDIVFPEDSNVAEKVANRFKASELEALAEYFDKEILRVKAYLEENEEVVATKETRQEKAEQAWANLANAKEQMDKVHSVDWEAVEQSEELVAKAQAAKFEDEISRVALYDTKEIDRIVYESDSVKIFNSESPYGRSEQIKTDGSVTRQYIRDDIMNKHATAYKLNDSTYKLVYSQYCIWYVFVS